MDVVLLAPGAERDAAVDAGASRAIESLWAERTKNDFWPKNHTDYTPLPGMWPDIHMTPAEGVQTHLDLQGGSPGGVLLPIHWGTFNLASHAWAEPGEWTKDAAEEVGQAVAFPRPGEPFEPAGVLPVEAWWRPVSEPIERPWRRPRSAEGVTGTSRGDLDLAGER